MIKKYIVWALIAAVFLIATPFVFAAADHQRGYNGTGGELLFPTIPVVLFLGYKFATAIIYEAWQILREEAPAANVVGFGKFKRKRKPAHNRSRQPVVLYMHQFEK